MNARQTALLSGGVLGLLAVGMGAVGAQTRSGLARCTTRARAHAHVHVRMCTCADEHTFSGKARVHLLDMMAANWFFDLVDFQNLYLPLVKSQSAAILLPRRTVFTSANFIPGGYTNIRKSIAWASPSQCHFLCTFLLMDI